MSLRERTIPSDDEYVSLVCGAMLDHYGALATALGFLAAALAAWVAVKWMIAWLERRGLALFGWYRVGLAIGVAAWLILASRAGS